MSVRPLLRLSVSLGVFALALACARPDAAADPTSEKAPAALVPPATGQAEAVFAGGCFWCMESPFESLQGVVSVTSGYAGGPEVNPTYEQVSGGSTGHTEAVRIVYDPAKVSYARLLELFWRNIDPTQADGQFCDHGRQYRTAIFYRSEDEKRLAQASRTTVAATPTLGGKPIVTELVPAGPFYAAENYHQDFYKKNPGRYYSYRSGCGRDARLEALWGKPADPR